MTLQRSGDPLFLFDLDGVVTVEESLVAIDRALGLNGELAADTRAACLSARPGHDYAADLVGRLMRLAPFPVSLISDIIAGLGLHAEIVGFIASESNRCVIVSSNLECFCRPLATKIGCKAFFSSCAIASGHICGPVRVIDKRAVVDRYKALGHTVVMIGDGANDAPAMRVAHHSIAAAYAPCPSPHAIAAAGKTVTSPAQLIGELSLFRART